MKKSEKSRGKSSGKQSGKDAKSLKSGKSVDKKVSAPKSAKSKKTESKTSLNEAELLKDEVKQKEVDLLQMEDAHVEPHGQEEAKVEEVDNAQQDPVEEVDP